jgi:hypothetical protein
MQDHEHMHKSEKAVNLTPWVLFTIFALGPCEVLIPQLMVPAADNNYLGVAAVALVFSVATIATMIGVVLLLTYGVKKIRLGYLEKYMAEKPEEFLEYSDWMGIPIQPYPITLDRLKTLLADQANQLSG